MQGQEQNPIPANSVLTEAMLDAWCEHFDTPNDESQRPGVMGTLIEIEEAKSDENPPNFMLGNPIFTELLKKNTEVRKARGIEVDPQWECLEAKEEAPTDETTKEKTNTDTEAGDEAGSDTEKTDEGSATTGDDFAGSEASGDDSQKVE